MGIKEEIESIKPTLHIYTDGSHLKHTSGKLKYSAWFKYEGREYKLSQPVDSLKVKEYYKKKYNEKVDISNPTLEVVALYKVLQKFKDTSYNLIIYSDYTGVKNWFEGNWKINKTYIKELISGSHLYAGLIEKNGGSVKIEWVKGHNGVQGNEMADFLSTQDDDCDTFNKFFEHYQ